MVPGSELVEGITTVALAVLGKDVSVSVMGVIKGLRSRVGGVSHLSDSIGVVVDVGGD